MAEASQQHQDQVLTWAIGLMGGGLFYLPNLLAQTCSIDSRPRFVLIAGPWALGILLALVGRMVSAHHRHVDNLAFFRKWQAIEGGALASQPARLSSADSTPEPSPGYVAGTRHRPTGTGRCRR